MYCSSVRTSGFPHHPLDGSGSSHLHGCCNLPNGTVRQLPTDLWNEGVPHPPLSSVDPSPRPGSVPVGARPLLSNRFFSDVYGLDGFTPDLVYDPTSRIASFDSHPSSAIGPSLSLQRLSVLLYRSVRPSGNNLECLPDHVTHNRVRLGEEASRIDTEVSFLKLPPS